MQKFKKKDFSRTLCDYLVIWIIFIAMEFRKLILSADNPTGCSLVVFCDYFIFKF